MPALIRITQADLRAAMREPRYASPTDPQRASFGRWVSEGYRAMYPSDGAARGAVWVRPYVRDRHTVSGHWRAPPPSHGSGGLARGAGQGRPSFHSTNDDTAEIQQVQWWRPLIPRAPRGGRGSGNQARPGRPIRRERSYRWEDPENPAAGDRVQQLRTQATGRGQLRNDIDQWERSGGATQRDADLRQLRPVEGSAERLRAGVTRYRLRDGRYAVLRNSTKGERFPTLEVQEPVPGSPRDGIATDKFRYID